MASKLRRVLITSLLVSVVLLVLGALLVSQWLDPGDKGDTVSELVTPTLTVDTARVFEVSAVESQVDFVAELGGGVEIDGVFPVNKGTITLEPVGNELRVLVHLVIDVDNVTTGLAAVSPVLRGAMETGDYPLAFFVATSQELVPMTEEEITFVVDGELEVHNVTHPHAMSVRAQLVSGDMWAIATAELDLAQHGVEFPALIGDTNIQLTARLQSYELLPEATE